MEYSSIIPKNQLTTKLNRQTLKEIVPFLGLTFLIILFQTVSNGRLLTSNNLATILNQLFPTMLCACGVIFVVSQGNLDMSIGSNVGICAFTGAAAAQLSPILGLPVALLTGVIIGLVNGSMHAFFNINATVATLCISFVLRGALAVLTIVPQSVPVSMQWIDSTGMKLAVLAVVLLAVYLLSSYSTFGKRSKAIGCNATAAMQNGVRVRFLKVMSYGVLGICAGIAGYFAMARSGSVTPLTGSGIEMDVLLALVLGGTPLVGGFSVRLRSIVVGSLMIAVISNGLILWGLNDSVQQLIRGIVFLIAVAVSMERTSSK